MDVITQIKKNAFIQSLSCSLANIFQCTTTTRDCTVISVRKHVMTPANLATKICRKKCVEKLEVILVQLDLVYWAQ